MHAVSESKSTPLLRAVVTTMFTAVVAAGVLLSSVADADAKRKKRKAKPNKKYAAYVIDAKSGKVLHASNAHAKRYPASLTKMMTLYLTFEDIKKGRIKESSRVVMTRNAANRVPSKLGIRPGASISVKQAILSLVTKSANDVSTALAEKLSGSEPAFARRMTRKARQLGMKNTTFKNANGLTARGQVTTARDMAVLGLALREHFPRKYKYFSTRVFKFGKRRMGNHNRLLGRVRGVDGIKTGYTRASGFNLVSSVNHRGRKIVAVVMGGRSGRSRNAAMSRLIKRYLPKASRGKQRLLVARLKSSRQPTKAASLQKQVKVAATKNTKPAKENRSAVKKTDSITTATTKTTLRKDGKRGWNIQIAASNSKKKASDLLAKARTQGPRSLRKTHSYMQPVKKNGVTLYRARFVGFKSAKAAAAACKSLKKERFSCIALKI